MAPAKTSKAAAVPNFLRLGGIWWAPFDETAHREARALSLFEAARPAASAAYPG